MSILSCQFLKCCQLLFPDAPSTLNTKKEEWAEGATLSL